MSEFNEIIGASLRLRGLNSEEASEVISVIHHTLNHSGEYISMADHKDKLTEVENYIASLIEEITIHRYRQGQCSVAGCVDTETTEEVFLQELGGNVLLCAVHRG